MRTTTTSTKLRSRKIADPVLVSLYNNRFMGIAEQMGRTYNARRYLPTSKSVWIFRVRFSRPKRRVGRQRAARARSFGAMSSTVSWQLKHLKGDLQDGDVLVTNHPCSGGSHLPTLPLSPPCSSKETSWSFCRVARASRGCWRGYAGFYAAIFNTLSEEGVAIESFKILKKGVYDEEGLVKILKEGKSRKIEDNLNDLRAQVAANARGIQLIRELMRFWDKGNERVHAFRANERRTSPSVKH